MANTYLQPGEVRSFTAAADLSGGDLVALGMSRMGIVQADVASGAEGEAHTVGVHALTKTAGTAAVAGSPAYWDASTEAVVMAPAAGAYFIGHFYAAAISTAVACEVVLAGFAYEPPRLLTLAATGNQAIVAADLLGADLTLLAPNTAALTVSLPSVAAVPPGALLRVRKTTADAHAVTLDPADSETIAGASTHAAIDAANDTALFQSTGAAWVLVDSSIA
jgi:predicted RecA/RadA family phage recombinase